MKLVNETGQEVEYWINCPGYADCGSIKVDGLVDLPGYDNKSNVVVNFMPVGSGAFAINVGRTLTDEQVEMFVVVE